MNTKRVVGFVTSCLVAVMMAGCRDDSSSSVSRQEEMAWSANDQAVFQQAQEQYEQRRWNDGKHVSHQDQDTEVSPSPLDASRVVLPAQMPTVSVTPSDEEYVTDVLIYAGCTSGAWQINVPYLQLNNNGCNSIFLTAARNQDGDFYEVATSFNWGITKPTLVDVQYPIGLHHGAVTIQTLKDLFLVTQQEEPMTSIVGCIKNSCPIPRPADCSDMLCAMVEVTSVINLEGEWSLEGEMIDPGTVVQLVQTGRDITDVLSLVKHGYVTNADVDFTIGDYGYHGTLAENRVHIFGSVKDLLSDTIIGSWTASRASP